MKLTAFPTVQGNLLAGFPDFSMTVNWTLSKYLTRLYLNAFTKPQFPECQELLLIFFLRTPIQVPETQQQKIQDDVT